MCSFMMYKSWLVFVRSSYFRAGDNEPLHTKPNRKEVFFPNKISGVDEVFGLLVHVLLGPNKQRAFEPSILLS
jgi:hypothetical protein